MKDVKVGVKKMTKNRRKMIEKMADSLLLSKHSIQFSALFLLLSVHKSRGKTQLMSVWDLWTLTVLLSIPLKSFNWPWSFVTHKVFESRGLCMNKALTKPHGLVNKVVSIVKIKWAAHVYREHSHMTSDF